MCDSKGYFFALYFRYKYVHVHVINFKAIHLNLCVIISNLTKMIGWGTLTSLIIFDLASKNLNNAPEPILK